MAAVMHETEVQAPETEAPNAGSQKNSRDAVRAQRKAKRREDAAMWRPEHATAYWIRKLNIVTDQAQYVYSIGFAAAQRSLYFLYLTLPDESDAVDAADADINARLTAVEKGLTDELARLRAVCDGIAAAPPSGYMGQRDEPIEVAVYTPQAARFARLVESYDELVQVIDTLWYAGHIDRKMRNNLIFSHRNEIVRFSRHIYLLMQRAKAAVTRGREVRDAAREAKSRGKAANAPKPVATEAEAA